MSEDLLSKITARVEKTGFPLELRVAELLKNHRYYVAHSLYYVDKEEGKSREVDLKALKNYVIKESDINHDRYIRNCLLVECKKSENKHWVFLSSEKSNYDIGYYETPHLPNVDFIEVEDIEALGKIHPFAKYDVMGRSYFEAFKNENNGTDGAIFKALTTVVKSTLYTMDNDFAARHNGLCFYYPIIVYDGRLFQGTLKNGKIAMKEVNSVLVSFLYKSDVYREGRFSVPVLKEIALTKFLESLEKSLEFVGDKIKSSKKTSIIFK